MVKRTHQTIWVVFALFVAYLLIVRLFITWAQVAPTQFGNTVAWATQSKISFNTLTIKQNWLGVDVEVNDAFIERGGLEVEAQKIAFDFNFFSPLVPRAPWGNYLTIVNLSVLEFGVPNKEATSNVTLTRFLNLNATELASNIDISRLWKKVDVSHFSAALLQADNTWRLNVDSFQAFKGTRWSLAADFNVSYGQVLQGERFQLKASLVPGVFGHVDRGEFSIKAFDAIDLARLAELTPVRWQAVLPDGEFIPNINGTISKSLLAHLKINLTASSLLWPAVDQRLPKSLGVNLDWQNQAKMYDGTQTNWQFVLSGIRMDDQFVATVAPVNIQLVSKRFLRIDAQTLDIKPFKPIIKAIASNESVAKLFDASAQLLLKNMVADLVLPDLYFENISVDIDRLAIPVTNLPGLVAKQVNIDKTGTQFKVRSNNPVWVMHPMIHPVPMKLELSSQLTGQFNVPQRTWSLDESALLWDTMPLRLSGQGNFDGQLALKSQIEPKTLEQLKRYLPYSLMTPKLNNWLKTALISGEQVAGQVYFNGDLADYPFNHGKTQFGGTLDLKNVRLLFHENWPEISNFDTTIHWSEFDLNIKASEVVLHPGVNAKAIDVSVNQLNTDNIAVEFSGRVMAQGASAIDYLLNGPIPKQLGLAKSLANKQRVNLDGGVEIALNKAWFPILGFEGKSKQIQGTVILNNNTLTLFDQLVFDKVSGLFKFTEKTLNGKNITASFQGGRAGFEVETLNNTITISGSGIAKPDFPAIVEGQANWQAKAAVPLSAKKQATALNLEMDATHLNWLMPAPLNNASLQGTFRSNISFENENIHFQGKLAQLATFDIDVNAQENTDLTAHGMIRFGKVQLKELREKSGLKVVGNVPLLDLDQWAQWSSPEREGQERYDWLKKIDWNRSSLKVDELRFMDYPYKDLTINWRNALNNRFQADIISKQVSTDLTIRPTGEVDVALNWLQLFLPKNTPESHLPSAEQALKVETCKTKPNARSVWPKVIFKGKNIRIDEVGVPALTFEIEDSKSTRHIKKIAATLENNSGDLDGEYVFYKDARLSSANVSLTSKNVKNLAQLIGLKRGFSGKRATVESNIVWSGGLACFSVFGLLGKTQYELKDGVIEDVEPGFARLLGLLNITSLARRLSLDLKDVTNKGFAYDTIRGETHFINGKLNLSDFKLKAPSASVELSGDVDLTNHVFDLKANVTPSVGSSLPALSALTGVATPLGALAVYVLMKAIPELNEELITYPYTVKGPWNKPMIQGLNQDEKSSENNAVDELLQLN